MQKIIFATGNEGKVREVREILDGLTINGEPALVLSMKEAGIGGEAEETGKSFVENAILKARAVAGAAGDAIVMADDSGLEIDYLDGEPGIYSARYMGEETSYREKNRNLIERLAGVPEEKRTARFVCAIACILPGGSLITEQAAIEGRIGYQERGENGFGYDPIFMVPSYGRSTAELSPEEKNRISHRGKTLRAIRKRLEEIPGFTGGGEKQGAERRI
ncbi:dITP/XTP pyrophosphatase [Lachnospiraceae bacterium]|nr:dITP/XTP pyrophosphatase [Lachnospiraceae bacterium]